MLSSSLRAGLLAVAFGAAQVAASRGLTLAVTGASSYVDVDNLKLLATITNSGDEALKILNDPLSPLSTLPANTFTVTDATGAPARFIGIRAKYSPTAAADAGGFTVLAPGETATVEHDISHAYDLTYTRAGDYTFAANNQFYIVDADNNISTILADGHTHTAKVSGRLAATRRDQGLTKRATFNGCSAEQQALINTAVSAATAYAADAVGYLNAMPDPAPRFETWFGTLDTDRHGIVRSHFSAISENTFSSFTYDCTCTDPNTFAYVFPDQFGIVYFCGAFWSAPRTGTDSQAGTIVHEASHFTANGGTDDIVYGQPGCRDLAISDPASAVTNADSHEYFAENNPFEA